MKICGENWLKWKQKWPSVVFAERFSAKRTPGMSPYELISRKKSGLPMYIEAATRLGIDWDEVKTTADLLHARPAPLLRSDEILDEAYRNMMQVRRDGIRYGDHRMAQKLRHNLLFVGYLVLYNATLE